MVAIIDYGMGNVASVQKALNFLNIDNIITNNHQEIKNADSILLPGVGSFMQGMINLKELKLDILLTDEVLNKKKKFLGICLGMHLIMEKGFEPVAYNGLGWVKGEVKKFDLEELPIPHMGWNDIKIINNDLLIDCNEKDFYFIHSYHVHLKNIEDCAATTNYGYDFVSCIQKENIFATQFHPEKSQTIGLELLKSFFNKNA